MMTVEKYDKIGIGYDATRRADPYLLSRLSKWLDPHAGRQYLDIGCGTGNYTAVLMQQGFDIIGMDPSAKMLAKAKNRFPSGQWEQGSATNTGLPSNSMDGIVGTLTIHHWPDLKSSFRELHRILKPGGRIVLFTSTSEQMNGYWLNAYFPQMLKDSIAQMPDLEHIDSAFQTAGFERHASEKYFVKNDLEDLFLYCGKHRPDLYLDQQVRNGISSFSDLANLSEVQTGLEKLAQDISSNSVQGIIDQYENDLGDYLFVVAEKY